MDFTHEMKQNTFRLVHSITDILVEGRTNSDIESTSFAPDSFYILKCELF